MIFRGDPSRVVLRPFTPADNPFPTENAPRSRIGGLVARICALDAETTSRRLAAIMKRLDHRHDDCAMLLSRRYHEAIAPRGGADTLTDDQIKLIGSYLLEEYAVEAAALFNPSIVAHHDQAGVAEGDLRVLLSLRAVGEGHVSSIVFRVGTVHAGGSVAFGAPAPRLISGKATWTPGGGEGDAAVRLDFGKDRDLSSLVLFPVAERHRNGLEDLRLTRFTEDDGAITYLGTYTGVGRERVREELLRTTDFRTFDLIALQGRYAGGKGMALFPRRIGGYYAMLGRQDHENIWLLTSNDLNRWDSGEVIIRPRWPWEFVQLGTCGPPIELEEGWLVITHGVGAIRSYCLGACLLDKADPTKLLARTRNPIVMPAEGMRDGYVPNVVYSCGALVHDGWLILPHGVADSYVTVASVKIAELLRAME
ncbi:glycoside hydrolase family 130 protein [Sphingomonas sp. IC-56]|uniref:glycoside hydrolase family 130 protein n=1 Tax=Sphingomonas sp. IC-56 TaxID=2898529 RepID=UPI001E4ACB18|nr:glycoside hydrolase family 130 protein [Sphingomonas sp. IC-56]MCD2324420.1 glycoside hydrolase family 130 protein [Sphingomonas sp. IC-56]